ncbi:MAG: T9SS type A sorting domain-containing protein [Saprospiraceae bacterium]|nr:T9SS type A sorting domain-containing protein [Saprospiraceae bacterium]
MKFLGTTALSLILCWLFLKPHLTAQVSIFAPTAQADPSTTIELDVIVTDFANIGGISFSMNWNPEILEIQGIENFALPDINPGQNYNIIGDEGQLGFLWFDLTLNGISLEDSTTFFTLSFNVIGEIGDSTGLSFTSNPTPIEVLDTTPAVLDANFQDGWVNINDPNQVIFYNASEIIQVSNAFPNPFNDFTRIDIDLEESSNTLLEIIDTQGKTVYSESYQLIQGKNELILTKDKFSLPGAYFVQLKSSNFTIRQKLIVF